ncbi:MAG TPA: SdpI family protein [Vicinamibacterales bacterium]|nr:SdpI family protein [Vicinamibacterales bacterium]
MTVSRTDAVALTMIAAMVGVGAIAWPGAPDEVPTLWSAWQESPRTTSRFWGLFGLPVTAAVIWGLFVSLPLVDPRREHYFTFRHPLAVVRTAIIAGFFAAQLFAVATIRAGRTEPRIAMPIIVGVLMVIIGNYAPKIQSNWFFGIRTPWTLTSEESWRRTHRLAGWLFVTGGTVVLLTAFSHPDAARRTIFLTLIPTIVISTVYSYLVWRGDRRTTAAEGGN